MGAEPIGSDPSGGRIVILAPLFPPKKKPRGKGGGSQQHGWGHTHTKARRSNLLSLSEGMDLGRQQGSSLRNRCFSAFLVWPGGLPGRKKESPSRRVNGAGPQAAHARGDAEQGGKAQPRLCSAFLLHPRTNPALLFPSRKGQGLSTRDAHGSTPGRSRGAQTPRARLCPSAPKPNAAPRGPFRTGLCRMEPELGCVEPQLAPSRGAAPSPGRRAGFGPAGPGGPNTKHAPSPAVQPHVHPKPQTLGEDSQEGTGSGACAFSRGPLALQSPPVTLYPPS